MRVKRSKSDERRKKMIYRRKRSKEKIAEDLQKDKERKRALSKKGGEGEIKNTSMNGRKIEGELRK